MDNESVRAYCLSFPHVTENVQWGADLVFKICGKMFTVISLEPESDHRMSFKATPEKFAELIERNGIVPLSGMIARLFSLRPDLVAHYL